jgi:hypothetical protein
MKLAMFPAFSGSWRRETYHIFYDMKISEMLSKFNHVSAGKTRLRRSFIASTSKCVSHRRSAAGSAAGRNPINDFRCASANRKGLDHRIRYFGAAAFRPFD